ncbi:hypothetical protein OESDEN_17842 [Oesophagostomum dentatum]|uniref:Uncharacterized protein n=1 Tax=Oesophagostomum dentatum TaxID=61180 RepID=A0A0B1SC15_OESDE|nr:hypothetical protein OESDEN_17842 [Oesophagostomum dentatum]
MYNTTSLERIEENYLNDDLFFENLVEQSVIDAYCALGDRDCIANYKALFDEKVVKNCKDKDAKPSECSTVAAPLRAKTYCYGVKEGGDEAFQKVLGADWS